MCNKFANSGGVSLPRALYLKAGKLHQVRPSRIKGSGSKVAGTLEKADQGALLAVWSTGFWSTTIIGAQRPPAAPGNQGTNVKIAQQNRGAVISNQHPRAACICPSRYHWDCWPHMRTPPAGALAARPVRLAAWHGGSCQTCAFEMALLAVCLKLVPARAPLASLPSSPSAPPATHACRCPSQRCRCCYHILS